MRKIVTTRRFEKRLAGFARSHPDLSRRVKVAMKSMTVDPFGPLLKTHRLSGSLRDCFASSITYNYRIVFSVDDDTIYFLDIGSHDEVYS
mgnify:CR=1 FL=1